MPTRLIRISSSCCKAQFINSWYIEYHYEKGNRNHRIVEVEKNAYLLKILDLSKNGAKISEMVAIFTKNEISEEESAIFIEELIDSQLLISELEPSLTGVDFFEQILSILDKLNDVDEVKNVLKEVGEKINMLDEKLGNDLNEYSSILEMLRGLGTQFDGNYLFQTDMLLRPTENFLNKALIFDLKKGISLLNKLTFPSTNTRLSNFKKAFYNRYGESKVPLSLALDTEIGLGYGSKKLGADNPLVGGIKLKDEKNKNFYNAEYIWSQVEAIFHKKLISTIKSNTHTVNIADEDFEDFELNWTDLPKTFSFIVEVLEIEGKLKFKFIGGGGSSGANLLARFCHTDKEIWSHTKKIVEADKLGENSKIISEIVHLPESRVGNVLKHPDFFDFEIPYLAKSNKPLKRNLLLDDLTL